MVTRFTSALIALSTVFALAGCGASTPEHVEKPLSSHEAPTVDFKSLKTPEEKIKFIEDSKAPESEKQKAIAQVKAGKI